MGSDEHCAAPNCQRANRFQHFALVLRVERTGRFVQQKNLRFHGKRTCDRGTLLLPTGQLIGVRHHFVPDSHLFQQLACQFLRFGAA